MKQKLVFIIFMVLLIFGILIYFYYNKSNKSRTVEAKVRYVSMNEILKIMDENENYIILDVRTEKEFNQGHIPNAICIPNENIDSEIVNQLPNKEQLILIYCRSGNRSKQATEKLKNLGYMNLIEFGGIIDWKGEIVK